MRLEDFVSNSLVINHFGEDSMKIVEKVVQYIGKPPYVSAKSEITKPERRFCAILTDKNTKGLALHGAGLGTGEEGYSLGIKEQTY